jgi:hypothetical protein
VREQLEGVAAMGIPKRGRRRSGGHWRAFMAVGGERLRAEGGVLGGGEGGARTADRGLVPVTARTREKFLKKVLNVGGTGGTVEQNCCNRWYIRCWSVPLSVPLTKSELS